MRTATRALALVTACLALAGPALAADRVPDPEKIFSRKDADRDGFLSLEEYKTGLKDKALENADRRFKKIDTDADGKLSKDEFKNGFPKPKP